MQTDASQNREAQKIASTSDWVSFYSRRLVEQMAPQALQNTAIQSAQRNWGDGHDTGDTFDDRVFQQHAMFDLSVTESGPLITQAEIDLGNNPKGQIAEFKAILAGSHLSMLEVTGCKRGRGVSLKNRLTEEVGFVSSGPLSESLEPLEVVLGRMMEWNGENILLPDWERIRFRGRKAAITKVRNEMAEAGLEDDDIEFRIAWLRREAALTARSAREA